MRVEEGDSYFVIRRGAWPQIGAAVALGASGLLLAAVATDALFMECERSRDRCSFGSVGVLQGGLSEGSVRLSSVVRWRTDSITQHGGGNRVLRRERHDLELTDGGRLALEPRFRSAVFDDLLARQFEAFRRSGDPSFAAFALHVGHAGFVIAVLLALAGVLLVLAESNDASLDFANGRFAVTVRGLRTGRRSITGAIADVIAVETLVSAAHGGLYLALRDGRRVELSSLATSPALASRLASRLRLPVAQAEAETIRRARMTGFSFRGLGCMLLALAPLGVGIAWWVLGMLWGALL